MFFVEVKTALTITLLSARADADDQMRERLRLLYDRDQSPSELHGISALGTKNCFHSLDKSLESLTPLAIPRKEAYINDNTAPVDRWDSDILTVHV